MNFSLKIGNILESNVEAIVNPANPSLLGQGGLSGIILNSGGYLLQQKLKELGPTDVGIPVITKGYDTSFQYIIHTPGPIYDNNNLNEVEQSLYDAYYNTLSLADDYQIKSLAFPAISTGIYNYPLKEAIIIAKNAIEDFNPKYLKEVYLYAYTKDDYDIMKEVMNNI